MIYLSIYLSTETSDVARPLTYKTKTTCFIKTKTDQAKTKTTFSRPRPIFLKTIKLLTQDHWRSQKFWLGGAQIRKFWLGGAQIRKKPCDVILVAFFGDIMVITSLKWRHNYILKFDFVIIGLKTTIWPNHGTSGHQYW